MERTRQAYYAEGASRLTVAPHARRAFEVLPQTANSGLPKPFLPRRASCAFSPHCSVSSSVVRLSRLWLSSQWLSSAPIGAFLSSHSLKAYGSPERSF